MPMGNIAAKQKDPMPTAIRSIFILCLAVSDPASSGALTPATEEMPATVDEIARQVTEAAEGLGQHAEELRASMETFVSKVRAA